MVVAVAKTMGFTVLSQTFLVGRIASTVDVTGSNLVSSVSPRASRMPLSMVAGKIPVINDWEVIARKKSITGRVQNHPTIPNGDVITTSPLDVPDINNLRSNQLVSTQSGSRYRLGNAKVVTKNSPSPRPATAAKPAPAIPGTTSISSAADDSKVLTQKLQQAKKEFNLNGKTVGNGKYLLVGQKLKSTSIRSEIYYAYEADSRTGLPKGRRITVKLSPKKESLARENLTYMKVTGGLFYRDNFVRKIDFLPDAQGNQGFAKGCSALVLESGERTLRALCDARGNVGLEGKAMRQAAVSIVQCIQAMQSYGLVWTDLKAENFVVINESLGEDSIVGIKAIDLESAVPAGSPPLDYSPEACPPEFARAMAKGEGPDFIVNNDYDSWSYGMLLYELAVGKSYFAGKRDNQITQILKQDGFEVDVSAVVDDKLRDLIAQCLQNDPKKRLSIAQILLHPYFLSSGIGPISF